MIVIETNPFPFQTNDYKNYKSQKISFSSRKIFIYIDYRTSYDEQIRNANKTEPTGVLQRLILFFFLLSCTDEDYSCFSPSLVFFLSPWIVLHQEKKKHTFLFFHWQSSEVITPKQVPNIERNRIIHVQYFLFSPLGIKAVRKR